MRMFNVSIFKVNNYFCRKSVIVTGIIYKKYIAQENSWLIKKKQLFNINFYTKQNTNKTNNSTSVANVLTPHNENETN